VTKRAEVDQAEVDKAVSRVDAIAEIHFANVTMGFLSASLLLPSEMFKH